MNPTRWALALPILLWFVSPAAAYITRPVTTLGQLTESTYITILEIEKVSKEKGIIIYRKVRDLKGTYPQDKIKHIFDLKDTPAHKGLGDVPVRPDEKDWKYAVQWAEPGKTAVMFTLKYDPFGDFGHTYIDGLWYASMCPPRDWELWYAIYAESSLLSRWCGGTPAQLATATEAVLAGKTALVPVLGEGTRDDLRAGKAKLNRLKVSRSIRDYKAERDLVKDPPDKTMVPSLIKLLQDPNRDTRVRASQDLAMLGTDAATAVDPLAELVRNDSSGTARMAAADALVEIGPEAKKAKPALEAALKDPRMANRKDVHARLNAAYDKLK